MAHERLVIVEDEVLLAMDMKERLEEAGYDVVGIATNDARAMELVDSENPDLVLMDIRIKGDNDGISVAAHMRSRTPTPVIFVSAFSDAKLLRRAEATEAYGYLVKPVRTDTLLATVQLALFKARRERQRDALGDDVQAVIRDLQGTDGLVVVCSGCHAIRDRDGHWLPVRTSAVTLDEAVVSHGLCPDCFDALYPDDR